MYSVAPRKSLGVPMSDENKSTADSSGNEVTYMIRAALPNNTMPNNNRGFRTWVGHEFDESQSNKRQSDERQKGERQRRKWRGMKE
jgi:hypothetical protein